MGYQYSVKILPENEDVLYEIKKQHQAAAFMSKSALINNCIRYFGKHLKEAQGEHKDKILDELLFNETPSNMNINNLFDNNLLI